MAHAVFFRRDAMFFAPCRQRPAGGLTRAPSENVRDITEEERNGSDMEERKCPQCGAQADPNAKVCIYCGTPLEEAAAPAQPVPPAGAASAPVAPSASPAGSPAGAPVPPQQTYTAPVGQQPQTPPPPPAYGAPAYGTPPASGYPQYCKHCGRPLAPGAAVWVGCGVPVGSGAGFCPNCGQPANPMAAICVHCGSNLNNPAYPVTGGKSKMAAGLLGIFLGSLGVHNFYLGYTGKAVAQLLLSIIGVFACGIGPIAAWIWGLVEGIQILTGNIRTDASGRPLND